jgi:hypothetical protein
MFELELVIQPGILPAATQRPIPLARGRGQDKQHIARQRSDKVFREESLPIEAAG